MALGGVIVAGIGAVFLLLGLIFFIIGKTTWKCTAVTTGQIIGMCRNAYGYNNGGNGNIGMGIQVGSSSPNSQCPILLYRVNGIEYRRASNVALGKGQIKRKMQSPQTIYYNPQNPEQVSLIRYSIFSIMGKIFLGIGAGMIILGMILIFAAVF